MSRAPITLWIAVPGAIVVGLAILTFLVWGVYATFVQGKTPGPDFIRAVQSNILANNAICSIEVIAPVGDTPFTTKELDRLPRRRVINSATTISRLVVFLKEAQTGFWPRNMNHPGSAYKVYLKVNTKDGFFLLYCNVEQDANGAIFMVGSNNRNATNPNEATDYYFESFSNILTILNTGP
ncbi:MAG TPA: hypothetical protein VK811_03805 [Candidatus Acidoferrum sp.]|nr:hypothetical protein [Candidatus Acidoferrum sp.]